MIRLIASDLDGTLLDPQGRLPEGIFDRILRLREKGVLFAAASGRQYGNLQRLFFPVRRDMAFLCENGAYIAAGDERKATAFPRAMAEEIIRDIQRSGMEVLISAPETSYVLPSADKAYLDDIVYRLRNTVTVIDDPMPFADGFIKISGFRWDGIAPFIPSMREKWGKEAHVDPASREWLDFTLANKGTGIRALCGMLKVPLKDTVAFGDHFNDVSMLEAVGHPYLMESAPEALKARGFMPCKSVLDTLDELLGGL